MEVPESESSEQPDEPYLDACDEFPFYDCPEPQTSSTISAPDSGRILSSSSAGLRRRPYRTLHPNRQIHTLKLDSDTAESASSYVIDGPNEDTIKLDSDRAEVVSVSVSEAQNIPTTTPAIMGSEGYREIQMSMETQNGEQNIEDQRESNDGQFNFLVFLADLLVKAIGFQLKLLITFITFPMWAFYYSCMFAVNPLRVLKRFRKCLIRKLMRLCNKVWKTVTPFVKKWFKEHTSLLKLALRCGWGLFLSVYVCCVLVTFLISAFVISGVLMRYYLLQEPFQLKEGLNFDYTKSKPVAFVPITSCPAQEWVQTRADIEDGDDRGVRVIPPSQKLQASVSLILPESGYNRYLGIFQIRVEFLSEKGKSLASISHPGMLEFRSKPIRLLSTLFKVIPLVAGYVSEAQTLDLKFKGYREGYIPTACIKVTIEQRAEFQARAGIPEVYDADLYLESELPFLKRMLWYWRRTLFVWLSMVIFVMELLIGIICCRPMVLPRARTASNTSRNCDQTSPSVQR